MEAQEAKSWILIWGWRVLWAVHINLVVLGVLTTWGIYRVLWAGDQITYTPAETLDDSEAVRTPTPLYKKR